MLEIRHLVITVVSIFLALILGILIGVGFANPAQLQDWHERFRKEVERIDVRLNQAQEDIALSREENSRLAATLEAERKAVRGLLPLLVKDRLQNRRVAVIQTVGLSEAPFRDQLTRAIQEAGGAVPTVVVLRPHLLELQGDSLAAVLAALDLDSLAPEQTVSKVCRQLCKLVVQGDPDNRLRSLVEAEAAEVTSDRLPVDAVVVLGGADEGDASECQLVDLPLLAVCQELGHRAVGVEPLTAGVSYMGAYQNQVPATVDNVDQLMGQLSLVYALSGVDGDFGVKETATELVPTQTVAGEEKT